MSKINYLYILSQRYSGSTLLSFLLANHPQIATIGERRKFYAKAIQGDQKAGSWCSCGAPFVSCPYWTKIRMALEKQLSPAQLAYNFCEFLPFRYRVLNKVWERIGIPALLPRRFAQMYYANELLVREILAQSKADTFLDSSKTYKQLPHLAQIDAFDLKIIWLTRDPRAQVSSAMKYNAWTVATATGHWIREIKAYQALLGEQQLPYLAVRYEELCRKPLHVLQEILRFAGLDTTTPISLDFCKNEQHIMGNGAMRLGKDSEIEERMDWQTRLTPVQIEEIEALTRDYQQYYTTPLAPH
ncbi:MAG: sulfotransferase [Bacteroidetes bacterium]|nr:MAG: sulfotransferase [Bacteroidota bacterium]